MSKQTSPNTNQQTNKQEKKDPSQQKKTQITTQPKEDSQLFSPTICGANPGEGVSESPTEYSNRLFGSVNEVEN